MAKKKGKAPAMPVYVREYMTDEHVLLMSLEQEGAYLRLLFHQWLEGTIPDDMPSLARLLRVTPQKMRSMWPRIAPCFVSAGPSRLVNPTLEQVRTSSDEYRKKAAEDGKRGAEKRWGNDRVPHREAIGSVSPAVAVAVSPSIEKGLEQQATEASRMADSLVTDIATRLGGRHAS